jgi:hypothetical protein
MRNQILTTEQKIDIIYNEVLKGNKLLDFLNVISVVIGFYNTFLNRQQIDNNAIMNELNKQDDIYFKQIISLLNEIKGDRNGNEQCNDATNDARKQCS